MLLHTVPFLQRKGNCFYHGITNYVTFTYSSGITQTTLGIGAAVGIAVVIGFVIIVSVLLFYCINKCQFQSSKSETPSHKQQPAGPQYEEVSAASGEEKTELRENIAYGPVQRIELRDNVAYESVHH